MLLEAGVDHPATASVYALAVFATRVCPRTFDSEQLPSLVLGLQRATLESALNNPAAE